MIRSLRLRRAPRNRRNEKAAPKCGAACENVDWLRNQTSEFAFIQAMISSTWPKQSDV